MPWCETRLQIRGFLVQGSGRSRRGGTRRIGIIRIRGRTTVTRLGFLTEAKTHGSGVFFPKKPYIIHVWYILCIPTWLVDFLMVNGGKYTSPMDPMGYRFEDGILKVEADNHLSLSFFPTKSCSPSGWRNIATFQPCFPQKRKPTTKAQGRQKEITPKATLDSLPLTLNVYINIKVYNTYIKYWKYMNRW